MSEKPHDDAGQKSKGQEPLGRRGEKYRLLFESIDEGFCIIEVLFDDDGQAVDYRFLELNPAFKQQTGLHNAVGKRMRELEPRHEEHWFETYGQVALTGEPTRFTNHAAHLGDRWYDVYAFRIGRPRDREVAVLFKDITAQKQVEEALLESKTQLAEEVAAFQRLHQMTTRIMAAQDMQEALDEILDASVSLLQADFGNIQLLDPQTQTLTIVAHSGFRQSFLDAFATVDAGDESACGRALRSGRRAVVEDVQEDADYAPYRKVALQAGYRAVQSTPLISHEGKVLGILSNHFREPTTLPRRAEQLLDLMARQAADLLERLQTEKVLEQRVRKRTAQVRQLASRLTLAEQKERDRIARVLHDDLQQRLYAVQLQLALLFAAFKDKDEAAFHAQFAETERELDAALGVTRQLSVDLSPAILHGEGLTEAVGWLATMMKEQYRLQVTVEAAHSFPVPQMGLRVMLFQTVRELLFNVVKHAGTDHAHVCLQAENDGLRITVQDDGNGFSPQSLPPGLPDRSGSGLATIRHRLSLVAGELQIESAPGDGVRATVVAPLQLESD